MARSDVDEQRYVFGVGLRNYKFADNEEVSDVLRKVEAIPGVASVVNAPVYSFMKPMFKITVQVGSKGTDVERAVNQELGLWPK